MRTPRRCLILLEYWSPSLAWLITGLQSLSPKQLGGWNFTCTDSRWFRGMVDHILSTETEHMRFESLIGAYGDLARGKFDCVLACETSELLWALPGFRHLPPVIILDGADSSCVSEDYFHHPCILRILKAQRMAGPIWTGNRIEARHAYANEIAMVEPWPYYGASSVGLDAETWDLKESSGKVFFSGWNSPAIRPRMIEALVQAQVPFEGGVHSRTEHPQVSINHDPKIEEVRTTREIWMKRMASAGLVLDLPGNGQLTHRMVEALMLGCPLLAYRRPMDWPGGEATDQEICWFNNEQELVYRANQLLADPVRRVQMGRAGRAYYERNLAPTRHAQKFMQVLAEEFGSESV